MKFSRVVSAILIIKIFLVGCYKELPLSEDGYQPLMVVAGVLVPGQPTIVRLTSNRMFGDTAQAKQIADAKISLYHGESLLGYLNYIDTGAYANSGLYRIDVSLQEGSGYLLKASHPDYQSIEAYAKIPKEEPFDLYINSEYDHLAISQNLNVSFTVRFPSTTTSHYAAMLYSINYSDISLGNDSSLLVDFHRVYDLSTDAPIDFFCTLGFFFSEGYKSQCERIDPWQDWIPGDDDFDPNPIDTAYIQCIESFSQVPPNDFTHPIAHLDLYLTELDDTIDVRFGRATSFFSSDHLRNQEISFRSNNSMNAGYRNRIRLYHLSSSLYKSFMSYASQYDSQDNLFLLPIPAYNNVEGGLGYFGGCIVSTIQFDENGNWSIINME